MPNFDVIIVGSGPAGVSAALPLVEAGLSVLMVDGGQKADILAPTQTFLTARIDDNEQWKWMIGKKFHALQMHDAVSPKLRVPTHKYVFEGFPVANQIEAEDFVAVGSLATGGLANAWGCGVARLSVDELAEFPFHADDIENSYETVARRIGISGCQDDDMSAYFGLDEWSQPPIKMDALHSRLYHQYTKRRSNFAPLGFRLGRSRVAALSENHAGREACDNSGNCLWGCPRHALYSASDELSLLKSYQNFHYESGYVVEGIDCNEKFVSVVGCEVKSRKRRSFNSHKVFLAAGTLATTRLALKALKLNHPVPLLSCPTAAFLLWLPRLLGTARLSAFGLGQLSFSLSLHGGVTALGSTFGTTGLPVTEFVRQVPFRRRYGVDLLRGLLSSCLVGNLFLPGDLSTAKAELRDDGSLLVKGGYSDAVPAFMSGAAKRLRQAYWKLGAILLPTSFTVGRPGGDIHYAGTLPMRETSKLGETNAMGELSGLEGVHVVDGACLPTLSEKSHTLTIMANADRISRQVSSVMSHG